MPPYPSPYKCYKVPAIMKSETMMKDTINTTMIKLIVDEKMVRGLVSDTSSIITSKMRGKLMGL